MSQDTHSPPPVGRPWPGLVLLIVVLILLVVPWFLPMQHWAVALHDQLIDAQTTGVLLFLLALILWNCVLPPLPLQLLAGFVYGVLGGTLLILAATSLATAVTMVAVRRCGRDAVQRWLKRRRLVGAIDGALAREGWRAVFLIRLSNCLPSNIASLLFGLGRVPMMTVLIVGGLAQLPGIVVSVLVGAAGGAHLMEQRGNPLGVWLYPILALSILTTLILATVMTRRVRTLLADTVPRSCLEPSAP